MSNAIIEQLTRIADALELANNIQLSQIAASDTERKAPNLRRPLNAYADFDPASIGATGLARDRHGWCELEWGGRVFKRYRSSEDDSKGNSIRFSRVRAGTVTEGNQEWEVLINFRDSTPVKPLRGELAERIAEVQAGQGGQGQPQGIAPTAPTTIITDHGRGNVQVESVRGSYPTPLVTEKGQAQGTTPTPALKAQAPAPAATEAPKSTKVHLAGVTIPKAEKDPRVISAALKAGATLDDVAAALNGSNGATLFWAVVRHYIIAKPQADQVVHDCTNDQRITNWGAAINALRPLVEASGLKGF